MLCASFELTPSPFNDSYEASVAYLRWESLCIVEGCWKGVGVRGSCLRGQVYVLRAIEK